MEEQERFVTDFYQVTTCQNCVITNILINCHKMCDINFETWKVIDVLQARVPSRNQQCCYSLCTVMSQNHIFSTSYNSLFFTRSWEEKWNNFILCCWSTPQHMSFPKQIDFETKIHVIQHCVQWKARTIDRHMQLLIQLSTINMYTKCTLSIIYSYWLCAVFGSTQAETRGGPRETQKRCDGT